MRNSNSKKDRIIGGTYNYYEHAAQIVQERGFKRQSLNAEDSKPLIYARESMASCAQGLAYMASKLMIFMLRTSSLILHMFLNRKMNHCMEIFTFQSGVTDLYYRRQLSVFVFLFCYYIRILTTTLMLKITEQETAKNQKKGNNDDYDVEMLFADFARESELFDGFCSFIVYMIRVRKQYGGGYFDAWNALSFMIGISVLPNADMNKGLISMTRSMMAIFCVVLKVFTLQERYAQPTEFAQLLTLVGLMLTLVHAIIVNLNEKRKKASLTEESILRLEALRNYVKSKLDVFTNYFIGTKAKIYRFISGEYMKIKTIVQHFKSLNQARNDFSPSEANLKDCDNKENTQQTPAQHAERSSLEINTNGVDNNSMNSHLISGYVDHSYADSDKSTEKDYSESVTTTPTKYHNPMQQAEFFQQFLDQYDENRIARFNSDIKEGNRKMAEVQLEMLDLNKQMKMVYQAVNSMKSTNKNLMDKNSNLTKNLANSNTAANELKKDLVQMTKEKAAIKQMAVKNENEIKKLKQQADKMERSIDSKNCKINDLQQQITQMDQSKPNQAQNIGQLDTETQGKIRKFSDEISNCHEQIGILTQKLESHASASTALKNDLNKAVGTIESQDQEISVLKEKLDLLSNKKSLDKDKPVTIVTHPECDSSGAKNQHDKHQKNSKQKNERHYRKTVGLGWRSMDSVERLHKKNFSAKNAEYTELKKDDSAALPNFTLSNMMKISPFTEILASFDEGIFENSS